MIPVYSRAYLETKSRFAELEGGHGATTKGVAADVVWAEA